MNMLLRHTVPSIFIRPLLGAGALVLGLLLGGCGGSSGAATGQVVTCGNPDTHCAPKP